VRVCRLLDGRWTDPPSLEDVATAVGFSRFHFHRLFKVVTGITPHHYMSARRARRLRAALRRGVSVTDAIYESGFRSNGNFYATSQRLLGMTPTSFRDGGVDESISYHVTEAFGPPVLVAVTGRGICDVIVGECRRVLVDMLTAGFRRAEIRGAAAPLAAAVEIGLADVCPPAGWSQLPPDIHATVVEQSVRLRLDIVAPTPRQARTLFCAALRR
jgi:AraC family transcriptional regulator of adaptative response/methylated-DNA-[protein]-cysteine methyltransferase